MAHVKDWILTKCREAPAVLHQETGLCLSPRFHNVIVTPDNIPEFTIPMTQKHVDSCPGTSDSDQELSLSSASLNSTGADIEVSPCHSTSCPHKLQAPNHNRGYCKSAPVSPSPTWTASRSGRQDSASYNDIDKFKETNIDPQSMRAMGLSHFKTKTPFGFDTLMETPHTRRKESLYFSENTPINLNRMTSRSLQNCKFQPINENSPNQSPRPQRRPVPCMVAPLGVLPPPQQWAMEAAGEEVRSQPSTPENRPQRWRRCSSYSGYVDSDDDSSSEPSPVPHRRNSGSLVLNQTVKKLTGKAQRQKYQRSCSLDTPDAPLGEIKLSIQYDPEQRQIKVILLKVDNLDIVSPQNSYFVKLYLSPGKLQKQNTSCIKNCLLINESFCFRHLDYNQVRRMSLNLKVISKEGTLAKRTIGQTQINFADLSLLQETRLWKCLEPSTQSLGQVTLSACFEACAQKLSVEVVEASHLRRGHLRGAPDPYIRLELTQPGRPPIRCQTKVKRTTTTPVFSEEFIMDISPKIEDLTYTTFTLTVFDRVHLRHDAPLGTVRLGYGAPEPSQNNHWNLVLQNPGKAYIQSHMLLQAE